MTKACREVWRRAGNVARSCRDAAMPRVPRRGPGTTVRWGEVVDQYNSCVGAVREAQRLAGRGLCAPARKTLVAAQRAHAALLRALPGLGRLATPCLSPEKLMGHCYRKRRTRGH